MTKPGKRTWFMVDVETDGPCPCLYSMLAIGIVIVEEDSFRTAPIRKTRARHWRTFSGRLAPISSLYDPEAAKVNGITREMALAFPEPIFTMTRLNLWIASNTIGKPMFISDNNGFDWQFVNWYFHRFLGSNPFGHSSTNLGSLYKGVVRDMTKNFKHLRQTKHTHDPVDDAMGNAEALLTIRRENGLHFPLGDEE